MIPELTAIGISLASLHIPYNDQNQFNPGIHLEFENVRVGAYRNSNSGNQLPNSTFYVGYSIPIYSTKDFRIGGNIAIDYGYASPIIGGLEFRFFDRLVVMAAPGISGTSTVLAVGYRIPL